MAWRLVIRLDDRVLRPAVPRGEHVLGSQTDADLRIDHPTVSRRHARLRVDDDGVTIEDLDSRNGLWIGSERVSSHRWSSGETIAIGAVATQLEAIDAADLEAAVVLDRRSLSDDPGVGLDGHTTFGSGPTEAFTLEALPGLVDRLDRCVGATAMAQAVGEALHATLPTGEVSVRTEAGGVVFSTRRSTPPSGEPTTVEIRTAGHRFLAVFPSPRLADLCRPIVATAARLVALAGRTAPAVAVPVPEPDPPALPDPPTVVPAIRKIYADAARVARGDVGVLILGESGTGKEVLARYLHAASRRADGPFLGLNCAALPADLLEAELFGIEKGVATGVDARPGRFELADGGTLFLDEVGDMALDIQAKILRVLQSGEVYRLGSQRPRPVRVRVLAATNHDVRAMLADGRFREDLYHRIATWVVELPPLRHRKADIVHLAAFFLARAAAEHGVRIGGISEAAVEALQGFAWPGNIRQLENEMRRAALFLEDGELLDSGRLTDEIRRGRTGGEGAGSRTLTDILERVERDEIILALDAAESVEAAAERLGISRATLYRRMKALSVSTS